ncbi:MAG TPA: ABC transporter permease [Candidatus Saccharimonadia bacterium]|nr:ABC transporter permease [Candidatus Saccharimonadia bacterium]
MNVHNVWTIVLRHMFVFRRNLDRLTDSLYWPVMDIVLWGLTSKWETTNSTAKNLTLIVLTGLVFWQIVWRANYEISVNLLEEFWNQNLVNLFSTPLTLGEWMAGMILVSIFKMILTVIVGIGFVWLFYSLNIFSVGWMFLPFMVSLMMSGWFMGFLGASIIIYWGQKVQTIAWTTGFLFAPFSAVYYPLSVLPGWIQRIGLALPMTYVFEGMRSILTTGTMPIDMLFKSFALNILYLILAMLLFSFMFEKSRAKGFSRLE